VPDYTQDGPAELPGRLTLIPGNTFRYDFLVEDYDEDTQVSTPFDLTGATGAAAIVVEAGGRVIAEPTVTISSPTTGLGYIRLAPADTTPIVPGVELRLGVQLTFASGDVSDIFEIAVHVRRGLVP
jgi:hypothetical protein